jgi:hypothetical protein
MAKPYFFNWTVQTLLPLQDDLLKRFAVMTWVQKLDELSKSTKPSKFHLEHFYDPKNDKLSESYLAWRYKGFPAPKLIKDDGTQGTPILFEEKFPGSLRILFHPGWVMLSGPTTIQDCRLLIDGLLPELVEILAQRFYIQAPDVISRKKNVYLPSQRPNFYTHCYVAWLKKMGNFEAFIGALGLSIEFFLSSKLGQTPNITFEFIPEEWSFCSSISKSNLAFLKNRIDDLNCTYREQAIPLGHSELGVFLKSQYLSLGNEQLQAIEAQVNAALHIDDNFFERKLLRKR